MMIEARHLTKRYGQTVAIDDACFAVRPGRVTGFLGPNGAGKSTTLEESFFDLTRDETDYHATQLTGVTTGLSHDRDHCHTEKPDQPEMLSTDIR